MTTTSGEFRGTKLFILTYAKLILAARYHQVVTYKELVQLLGLPYSRYYLSKVLGQILGEISEDEINHGRPMLSTLAVGVQGTPGEGFYGWARNLGKLKSEERADEKAFWASECKAVYDTWKVDSTQQKQ